MRSKKPKLGSVLDKAVPVPVEIPPSSGTPAGRAYYDNPVFASVPMINTSLIPPLIPTRPNELKFADAVWAGLTPYIAFRDVYGLPDTIEATYRWINRKLWSRAVRLRLHQLDKMACDMDTKSAENRRNFVLNGLTEMASDDSITPMARLKALELLGKVRGTDLFNDKVEHVVHNMSEEQVKAALAEKLAQLGAGAAEKLEDLKQDIKVIEHVQDDAPPHEHQPSLKK